MWLSMSLSWRADERLVILNVWVEIHTSRQGLNASSNSTCLKIQSNYHIYFFFRIAAMHIKCLHRHALQFCNFQFWTHYWIQKKKCCESIFHRLTEDNNERCTIEALTACLPYYLAIAIDQHHYKIEKKRSLLLLCIAWVFCLNGGSTIVIVYR